MNDSVKYLIIKDKNKKETTYFECDKLSGYDLTANKKSKLINGVNINKIVIINDRFVEKVINKKIEKRFKVLLELMASVCESDEDPGSGMRFALNEIERFKREMINKYVSYMNKNQIELLDKKVKLIEKEMKSRMYQYMQMVEEKDYESEKTTGHRRR